MVMKTNTVKIEDIRLPDGEFNVYNIDVPSFTDSNSSYDPISAIADALRNRSLVTDVELVPSFDDYASHVLYRVTRTNGVSYCRTELPEV